MNGTLPNDQFMALNGIGFKWEEPAADWNNMMRLLKLFCQSYGDCLVPAPPQAFQSENEQKEWWCDFYEEFRPFSDLWWWVQWIRAERKRGIFSLLTPEQIGSLNRLDFMWSAEISETFVRGFRKLKAYWKENGTYSCARPTPLGNFVQRCRRQYNIFQKRNNNSSQISYGDLTLQPIAFLEEINFKWRTLSYKKGDSWDYRFDKLCKFSEENGHCMVPQAHKELGQRVKKQRQAYVLFQEGKPCDLDESKVERLESLGFIWRIRNKRGLGRQHDKLQHVQANWRNLRAERQSKESKTAEKS
mmetsp:Transcript_3403/g.8823  ORF Transcript_3403/g.8823 Transcript_3403/m.8823 type:complete len:302 (-) Transcript_3403:701-1606(-)